MFTNQAAFDSLKASILASLTASTDYLKALKSQLAAHDAQTNQKAVKFFQDSLDNVDQAVQELQTSAGKLPERVEATRRIYLKDVKASVAKLNDQVETLKGEADAYDAKCNANVGLLLVEQKQRIAEHLQHANEHLDALYVSHI
ncbi:hypothetical protein LEN26_005438 [Aphanomyces euteiches]|nr:hypothetical protein AeMF1_000218 [Aphanomyces euteiches]KAH9138123.1 hypothetical protein LEN26_005438 [Aphanomyces euteiches]KAH9191936.1 hypothetical protein AeNC1_006078 [Aphanomyces euteiches]